ncbi:MAG: respiratory nitrate reductase subunit beta, partial [Pseudomonadales bacterium]|nr:respiratory nitrate reductase subunit beta [Pseudomonadales bacterium]
MNDSAPRQIAMVINLDGCIGCQTCTMACKGSWTRDPGQEHMLWGNVESRPGAGYPRDWESMGGGFDEEGRLVFGELPTQADYGPKPTFAHQAVLFEGAGGDTNPEAPPDWGPNWDEDQGGGTFPNQFNFYLPRLCN